MVKSVVRYFYTIPTPLLVSNTQPVKKFYMLIPFSWFICVEAVPDYTKLSLTQAKRFEMESQVSTSVKRM